jgi:hypothetical protein
MPLRCRNVSKVVKEVGGVQTIFLRSFENYAASPCCTFPTPPPAPQTAEEKLQGPCKQAAVQKQQEQKGRQGQMGSGKI